MRYLITGGAGFIGSHLADALLERGNRITLFDNLSTGTLRNVAHLMEDPRVEVVQGDALDAGALAPLIEEADAVAHLAATVGVQLVVQNPLQALLNNIRGTEVLLELVSGSGIKVLIPSTSEIYGKNGGGPLREDADRILGSPFKARWAYSTSKAVDEILAYGYWRMKGLPTVVVRLFNCAGPRQTGAYGMVIPRFVTQALAGDDLTVFGDGTQARCFCHVADTVDALVRLLDADDAVGEVFNVGSQNEISVRRLAERVIELARSSSGIRYIPYEQAYEPGFEDMQRRLPDISKIRGVTGWEPTRSLDEIILDVIEYQVAGSTFRPSPTIAGEPSR